MSWNTILQNDPGPHQPLRQRIDALFAQQRDTWQALRDGEAALWRLQKKTLHEDGQSVIVQVNPARRSSTLAKTDAKSIAARVCFLCPENMPAEERGVAFEDLVVLPNPYPVLPLHCTIAGLEHRPQRLTGRIDTFLRLAAAIGPELAAFYNGPRCGASVPDHFHFQAARAAEIPILAQLPKTVGECPNFSESARKNGTVPLLQDGFETASGRSAVAHSSFGRNMLIFASSNAADVQANIERSIDALRRTDEATDWGVATPPQPPIAIGCLGQNDSDAPVDEPMFNLLAHFNAGRYTALLFPRAAHRPARYFATGPDHLAVSPAVLEMAGILVTTDPAHFARLDAPTARAIYKEVTIPAARFEQLIPTVT